MDSRRQRRTPGLASDPRGRGAGLPESRGSGHSQLEEMQPSGTVTHPQCGGCGS